MNESFESYLQVNGVDQDALLEAFRTYIAERVDYLPPEEMVEEMAAAAGDPSAIDDQLSALEDDTASQIAVANLVLSGAWEDPQQRVLVEELIASAKQKLPVIELGILAIVAMYGMYLYTTGGVARRRYQIQNPDGSTVEEEIEFAPPSGPLKAVVGLFRPGGAP